MGNVKRAVDSLEKALRIYKHMYGEEHQKVAACLNNIGLLYNEEKNMIKLSCIIAGLRPYQRNSFHSAILF
jgi:hypothetical protein